MNSKLTPEQLKHYRQHLHDTVCLNLLNHIAAVEAECDNLKIKYEAANTLSWMLSTKLEKQEDIVAVEAERDEATALLRRLLDRLAELDTCLYCGEAWTDNESDKHAPDCVIPEARAWLAKVESDVEGGM